MLSASFITTELLERVVRKGIGQSDRNMDMARGRELNGRREGKGREGRNGKAREREGSRGKGGKERGERREE